MIIVNENNCAVVKRLKYSLWSFMNTVIDLPMSTSLELFGRHTTYRYCKNIELDKVEVCVESIRLLIDNITIPVTDIYNTFPEYQDYILRLYREPWDRLVLSEGGPYSEIINNHHREISVIALTPEKVNRIFKHIRDNEDVDLIPLYVKIYKLDGLANDPFSFLSWVSSQLPSDYFDCLVIKGGEAKVIMERALFLKERFGSLMIANNFADKLLHQVNINKVPWYLKANDIFNLGISKENTSILKDSSSWVHLSNYSKISSDVDVEEVADYILGTSRYHLERLSHFTSDNRIKLIEHIMTKDCSKTVTGDVNDELILSLYDMITNADVTIGEVSIDKLIRHAGDNEDPKYIWGLFLTNSFSDELTKSEIIKLLKR